MASQPSDFSSMLKIRILFLLLLSSRSSNLYFTYRSSFSDLFSRLRASLTMSSLAAIRPSISSTCSDKDESDVSIFKSVFWILVVLASICLDKSSLLSLTAIITVSSERLLSFPAAFIERDCLDPSRFSSQSSFLPQSLYCAMQVLNRKSPAHQHFICSLTEKSLSDSRKMLNIGPDIGVRCTNCTNQNEINLFFISVS